MFVLLVQSNRILRRSETTFMVHGCEFFLISSCALAYTQTNANHGYSHRFLSYIYMFSTWLSFQVQASCYTYCIWNNYYFPNMLAVRFYLYHDNNRYALHSVEQEFELSVYIRNNAWVNAKISLIIFINLIIYFFRNPQGTF